MKTIFSVLFTMILISACASTDMGDQIRADYQTVTFDDGINLEEAIFIAKNEVFRRTPPDLYVLEEPNVVTEFEDVPHHEDYWFVSFNEQQPSPRIPVVYMVALNKQTGKIVFSRSYTPENEWILQAAFLKLHEKSR